MLKKSCEGDVETRPVLSWVKDYCTKMLPLNCNFHKKQWEKQPDALKSVCWKDLNMSWPYVWSCSFFLLCLNSWVNTLCVHKILLLNLRSILTVSTVWNTGETGDIYPFPEIHSLLLFRPKTSSLGRLTFKKI